MADALQSQVSLNNGFYRWSDSESPASDHKDRLAAPISIEVALPEAFTGLSPRQRVEVQVKEVSTQDGWSNGTIDRMPAAPNTDPTLADIAAGQDIYGWPATARLYHQDTATSYLTFDGIVADLDFATGAMTLENRDLAALATEVPKRRLLDLFPEADLSTAPVNDPRVIVVFGERRQVRLTRVLEAGGFYYYGAWRKAASGAVSLATVYRDRRVVDPSEYSVVELAPGLMVVRFSRPQVDLSGRELEIRGDLTSTEFATHADAGKFLLTDATDGLGKPVNAASFSQAAADFTAASYAVGGGIGPEPIKAEDLLKDLALRGSLVQLNSAGEYTWQVDKAALHTAAQYNGRAFGLGRGDGHWENIQRVLSLKRKRLEERPKSYTMQGQWSEGFGQGAYLLTARASRSIAHGVDLPGVTNRYIDDLTTLQKETGYRLARLAAAEQQCSVEVINEARVIALYSTVPITIPGARVSASSPAFPYPWGCVKIQGSRDNWILDFEGYDSSQYSAVAAYTQLAPGATVLTDYTYSPPQVAPILGTITFQTRVGDDGSQEIVIEIPATASAEQQITGLLFHVFQNGSAVVLHEKLMPVAPGASVTVQIGPLAANKSYDVRVYGYAGNNAAGFQIGVGAIQGNKITPNSPGAPGQVTGLTLVAQPPRAIRADWNDLSDTTFNLDYYEVQSATDSGFTANVRTRKVRVSEIVLSGLTNGTTYFVRVRAVNRSRQPGTYSSTVSLAVSRTAADDIGDGTITGGSGAGTKLAILTVAEANIANLAVTNAKINDLSAAKITTGLLTVNPASGGATAIYIENAGKIRLETIAASPSRIVFEDTSATEKSEISGTTSSLVIQPSVNNTILMAIGTGAKSFSTVEVRAVNAVTLDAGAVGLLSLIGSTYFSKMESAAPAAATPNRRLPFYSAGGAQIGYLWGSTT